MSNEIQQLVKALTPALMEAHVLVFLPVRCIFVKGSSRILRPAAVVFEREDCGEERLERWAVAGRKGISPDQSFILDDLQEATNIGKVLSLR